MGAIFLGLSCGACMTLTVLFSLLVRLITRFVPLFDGFGLPTARLGGLAAFPEDIEEVLARFRGPATPLEWGILVTQFFLSTRISTPVAGTRPST